MWLFKVAISAVFGPVAGSIWRFRGTGEMGVKIMRIRLDVVTVLCEFKVHFASVFSFFAR